MACIRKREVGYFNILYTIPNIHFRFQRNLAIQNESREEQLRAPHGRIETQVFHARSPQSPDAITFHPFEQHIAIACKDYFGQVFFFLFFFHRVMFLNALFHQFVFDRVWDRRTNARLTYCPSRSVSKVSRITSLEFLNAHDSALLLAGSDDGSIRVWKNYYNMLGPNAEPTLLTAWQALSDVQVSNKNSLGN